VALFCKDKTYAQILPQNGDDSECSLSCVHQLICLCSCCLVSLLCCQPKHSDSALVYERMLVASEFIMALGRCEYPEYEPAAHWLPRCP